jgi:hypothetical protein
VYVSAKGLTFSSDVRSSGDAKRKNYRAIVSRGVASRRVRMTSMGGKKWVNGGNWMCSGICRTVRVIHPIRQFPGTEMRTGATGGSRMHRHEFGRPSEGVLQRKKTLSDFLEKIQDKIRLQLAGQLGASDGNYCVNRLPLWWRMKSGGRVRGSGVRPAFCVPSPPGKDLVWIYPPTRNGQVAESML